MGYTGKILNVNLSEGIIRETKHRAAKVRYSRACEHYQQCRRSAFLNWQKAYNERADEISGERLAKEFLRKRIACWGCSIGCRRATEVKEGHGAL